jgi:hypothetical protein
MSSFLLLLLPIGIQRYGKSQYVDPRAGVFLEKLIFGRELGEVEGVGRSRKE